MGENEVVGEIDVQFGNDADFVQLKTSKHFTILIPDTIILVGDGAQVEKVFDIPQSMTAPIKKDDYIGDYVIKLLGEEVGASAFWWQNRMYHILLQKSCGTTLPMRV